MVGHFLWAWILWNIYGNVSFHIINHEQECQGTNHAFYQHKPHNPRNWGWSCQICHIHQVLLVILDFIGWTKLIPHEFDQIHELDIHELAMCALIGSHELDIQELAMWTYSRNLIQSQGK